MLISGFVIGWVLFLGLCFFSGFLESVMGDGCVLPVLLTCSADVFMESTCWCWRMSEEEGNGL